MLQSSAYLPLLTSIFLNRLWFAIREAQDVIKSITPPVVIKRVKFVCVILQKETVLLYLLGKSI